MEKRNFLRANYRSNVIIKSNEMEFSGEILNLSLNGAMVKSVNADKLKVDDKLEVIMNISSEDNSFKICSSGVVIRIFGDELGLKFETMDLESFTHLRNLIAYNSGEYDKIMEELIANAKDMQHKERKDD